MSIYVCTYDNPATMSRECWQDGRILYAYDMVLLGSVRDGSFPREHFFFGASIGPWKEGQLIGDSEAMHSRCTFCGETDHNIQACPKNANAANRRALSDHFVLD